MKDPDPGFNWILIFNQNIKKSHYSIIASTFYILSYQMDAKINKRGLE